ncbi:hypothetical protein GOODEAATRI_023521 [Goodea atripinnis]|uniref:Uncharacterized protein n=1 Tax=Goodea atripinnis TaxID=208336 RepID=A0ABV0MLA6_9TELE
MASLAPRKRVPEEGSRRKVLTFVTLLNVSRSKTGSILPLFSGTLSVSAGLCEAASFTVYFWSSGVSVHSFKCIGILSPCLSACIWILGQPTIDDILKACVIL